MKIESKPWNGEPKRYAHLKYDGNFIRIVKDVFGSMRIYSSQNTDLTDQLRLCKTRWFANLQLRLPAPYSLLGELYYPQKPASVIKTAIVERDSHLRFAAFAVESLAEDLSIEEIERHCLYFGVEFAPYQRLSWYGEFKETYTEQSLLENNWPLLAKRTSAITEGFMLKDGNLLNWRKLKQVKTIDCFISDFREGDGKYFLKVGSIACSVYHNGKRFEIATAGGFSDAMRDWITENRDYLLNKKQVVELEYQYVGSKGRLRHPRFKKLREDKVAEECLASQDLELETFYRSFNNVSKRL